jgi:hypothetical protein
MQIWNYHPTTSELLGASTADPDQLEEGNWIIPAYATTIAPPSSQPGFAETFIGSSWSTVADHRGETWWPTEQQYNDTPGVVVTFLGDPASHGLTNVEPVIVPPIVVSALQIRLALSQQGLRSAFEAHVTTADQATVDSWQFATSFERNNSIIAVAAAAIGKTPADVDALFALAKTL